MHRSRLAGCLRRLRLRSGLPKIRSDNNRGRYSWPRIRTRSSSITSIVRSASSGRARNLQVEGRIPDDIQGAFFRAVPDPAHPPLFADDSILSGDGMISCFRFENGAVDHEIRYLRTPRFEAERKARRALFGRYRNPFTDLPEVRDVDRAVANTTPVWHGGPAVHDQGRCARLRGESAHARDHRPWTYGGKLRSPTMTAHPRVDPVTGEMFMFGYEAGGLATDDVAYSSPIATATSKSEQWFRAPYCSLMHDFGLTQNWAIFPVFPTKSDTRPTEGRWRALDARPGGEILGRHHAALRPRRGDPLVQGAEGHLGLPLRECLRGDGQVHLDVCLRTPSRSRSSAPPRASTAIRATSGSRCPLVVRHEQAGRQLRARATSRPPGDLPRLRDIDQGRPYTHFWLPSSMTTGGPPVIGGPVGTQFNALLRVEPSPRSASGAAEPGPATSP